MNSIGEGVIWVECVVFQGRYLFALRAMELGAHPYGNRPLHVLRKST